MNKDNANVNSSAAAIEKPASSSAASEKRTATTSKKESGGGGAPPTRQQTTKKAKIDKNNIKSPRPPIANSASSAKDKRKSSATIKKVPADKAIAMFNVDPEVQTQKSSWTEKNLDTDNKANMNS